MLENIFECETVACFLAFLFGDHSADPLGPYYLTENLAEDLSRGHRPHML